jgi:hypothetical protein
MRSLIPGDDDYSYDGLIFPGTNRLCRICFRLLVEWGLVLSPFLTLVNRCSPSLFQNVLTFIDFWKRLRR